MRFGWAIAFAFAGIGFVGALYEIFEWLLTIIAEGNTADWYNGQQGDLWDPQKDLAAAQVGSLLTLTILAVRNARQVAVDAISGNAHQPKE